MTSWDERDSADLARRRSLLSLPMIPLRRDARRWLQPEGWPDMRRWVYDPVAVGVGPDGRVLSLVRDRRSTAVEARRAAQQSRSRPSAEFTAAV